MFLLSINLYFTIFRERLAEVHEEYEEREHRWNRIASLLDNTDFITSSSITNGN